MDVKVIGKWNNPIFGLEKVVLLSQPKRKEIGVSYELVETLRKVEMEERG